MKKTNLFLTLSMLFIASFFYAPFIRANNSVSTDADSIFNLAPYATISVSSEYGDTNWSHKRLTDGIFGIDGTGEWASDGEITPWAQLDWTEPITTNKVVLYDRPTDIESIRAGELTFSDGTPVLVGEIPDTGSVGLEVIFEERSVTWVRFTVTDGDGPNGGLAEFEVIGKYTGSGGDPTSIRESQNTPENDLYIYPNPVSGVLNIPGINGYAAVEIFNVVGKKVMSTHTSGQLRVGELQKGMYILVVNGSNKFKFMKE